MFGDFIAQSDGFYYLLIFRLVIFILHLFAQSLSNFINVITVLITHVFLGQHKMAETNIKPNLTNLNCCNCMDYFCTNFCLPI